MIKAYVLIGSDVAIDSPSDASYFYTIVSKTFPTVKWEKVYTDDIPMDGNIYICYQNAISELYKDLVSSGIFKLKDILNDFVLHEAKRMYIASFNYDLEAIRSTPEVKRSAFTFLTEVVKPNIEKIVGLEDQEEVMELTEFVPPVVVSEEVVTHSETIPEQVSPPVILEPTEEETEELMFYINSVIAQMIGSSTTKIADRSLSTFEGIQIFSSSNPKQFITLASSARKEYPNKMLVSELFIILKAAQLVGADSIKFHVRKSATHV